MSITNKRIEWVDYTKGLLLFAVASAHMGLLIPIWSLLPLFYMPAFFTLSGYLLSEKKMDDYKSYISSKSYSLLLPYLLFSIIFLILNPCVIFHNGNINYSTYFEIINIINGYSVSRARPLWFLFTLFQVSMFELILYRFVYKNRRHATFLRFAFSIASFIMGSILYRCNIQIFFHIETMCTSYFYYCFGVLFRKIDNTTNIPVKCIILPIFALVFIRLVNFPNYYPDLYFNRMYDNILVYLIATILGIIIIFWIVQLLSSIISHIYVGRLLQYLATNSVIFLALHMFVSIACKDLFPIIFEKEGSQLLITIIVVTIPLMIAPLFNKYLKVFVGKR